MVQLWRTGIRDKNLTEFITRFLTSFVIDDLERSTASLFSIIYVPICKQDFDITAWYLDLFKEGNDRCQMVRTMAYPQLGPGMLYYNVFRRFDALVVLAKNHTMKLEYGNVQRAISQMRSGVPVLLEIRGRVFEEFMEKYNYSCAFRRYNHEPSTVEQEHTVALMSFDEAVEKLKDPEVRRDCQRQGLEIVKDYSPSKIGQKFLKTVGYEGNFLC